MRKQKKVLLAMLCAVLLVVSAVCGTLAYLTDTDDATNTFTVGKVDIMLDEADVDDSTEDAERDHGNAYHLLPGHTYDKDPTVTVVKGSENVYVRMMVKVEGLEALKAAMPKVDFPTFYNGDLFLLQNLCVDENNALTWDKDVWLFETFHTSGDYVGCYEFRYATKVSKNAEADTVLPALFEKITVPGEVDNDQLLKLADVQIVVTAHAIQADGFADADAAWAKF